MLYLDIIRRYDVVPRIVSRIVSILYAATMLYLVSYLVSYRYYTPLLCCTSYRISYRIDIIRRYDVVPRIVSYLVWHFFPNTFHFIVSPCPPAEDKRRPSEGSQESPGKAKAHRGRPEAPPAARRSQLRTATAYRQRGVSQHGPATRCSSKRRIATSGKERVCSPRTGSYWAGVAQFSIPDI
jgi:hypothetical protein